MADDWLMHSNHKSWTADSTFTWAEVSTAVDNIKKNGAEVLTDIVKHGKYLQGPRRS